MGRKSRDILTMALPYLPWTEHELRVLRESTTLTDEEIAALLKVRTPDGVRLKRRYLEKKREHHEC